MNDTTVEIEQSVLKKLRNDSAFLGCLNACGVDNWCGYDDALEMLEEEET